MNIQLRNKSCTWFQQRLNKFLQSIRKIKARGFTLIELLVVIVVITILAVVASPRWQGSAINLSGQAEQLANDLRYTQSLSIASGQRYYLSISSNTYQIRNQAGSAIMLSTGGNSITLGTGITFGSFTNCPNNLIMFDGQGTPYTTTSGTLLSSAATLRLTSSGQTRSVIINPVTGSVSIQ